MKAALYMIHITYVKPINRYSKLYKIRYHEFVSKIKETGLSGCVCTLVHPTRDRYKITYQ